MKKIILLMFVLSIYAEPEPPPPDPPPMPALYPPTPIEMGFTPPLFPPECYVTNVVYMIPEDVIIRFQTRDSLTQTNWYDATVIRSKRKTGFYRVVIER